LFAPAGSRLLTNVNLAASPAKSESACCGQLTMNGTWGRFDASAFRQKKFRQLFFTKKWITFQPESKGKYYYDNEG
jgi:hypothetical protein